MNRIAKLVRQVRNSIDRRGVLGTITVSIGHLRNRYDRMVDARFDRRYGTDTSGTIEVDALGISSMHRLHAARYEPITEKIFTEMMGAIAVRHDEYVFIDLGSGKGRSLLLAARFPFKRIIGVEVSKKVHDIAVDNVRRYLAHTGRTNNFELHCTDAMQFAFPRDNAVLFLYNPFRGPVMSAVLSRLTDSYKRFAKKLVVLYRNPQCADHFDQQSFLTLMKKTRAYHIYSGKLCAAMAYQGDLQVFFGIVA